MNLFPKLIEKIIMLSFETFNVQITAFRKNWFPLRRSINVVNHLLSVLRTLDHLMENDSAFPFHVNGLHPFNDFICGG
jgi:hypothetical protein